MYWENDLPIPCFYTHMVGYRHLKCINPDAVFLWTPKFLEYFDTSFARKQMKDVQMKGLLPPAVDTTVYQPRAKKYKGVNGIGYRSTELVWKDIADVPASPNSVFLIREINDYKSLGLPYHDGPITDDQYRELIAECEILWTPIPPMQWISRRILEAMACKTLMIFNLESKAHEDYLKSLGLENGIHYIGIESTLELKGFTITKKRIKEITENAYKVIIESHSYVERAKQLLEKFQEFLDRKIPLRITSNPLKEAPYQIPTILPSPYDYVPKTSPFGYPKVGKLNDSVVVLSMERTGTSWLTAMISEAHRQLYGVAIDWDHECSRFICIDPKYEIPKNHCGVYCVKVEWLLRRPYKKIIVMKRDIESLIQSLCRYYVPSEKPEDVIANYPQWIEKIRFYYDMIYGQKVMDKRVLYVELSDMNNFPVAQFHEILDFLEYPLEIGYEYKGKTYVRQRPAFVPINIKYRDWDIQGTIINKGHGFDPIQEGMIKHTGVRGMMPIVDPDLASNPEATKDGYVKSKTQFVHYERLNPWIIAPEEDQYQEGRVYRIKPNLMVDGLEVLGYLDNDGRRLE